MSVGAVLTEIFDIVWLLSVLGLQAAIAWLVWLIWHDIRELKPALTETTAESSRAMELLANAISHMELLLAANLPQATAPTTTGTARPVTKPPAKQPAKTTKPRATRTSTTKPAIGHSTRQ